MTDSCHTGRDFAQPLQKQQQHKKYRNKEMKRKRKTEEFALRKAHKCSILWQQAPK